MKKLFLTLISLVFLSCKQGYGLYEIFGRADSVRERATGITKLEHLSLPKNYTFALITDVHFGAKKSRDVDKSFFAWLQGLKAEGTLPKFIVCLGDVAEHGNEDEFLQYNNFVSKIKNDFALETFTILGNHDLYKSGYRFWKKLIFPHTSFYVFETNAFSFYFLDNANGSFSPAQYFALAKIFSSDKNPKLCFAHIPLYADGIFFASMQDTRERNLVLSQFAKSKVKAFFAGHTHRTRTSVFRFPEYTIPGFLEKEAWALVSVDEARDEVKVMYE